MLDHVPYDTMATNSESTPSVDPSEERTFLVSNQPCCRFSVFVGYVACLIR